MKNSVLDIIAINTLVLILFVSTLMYTRMRRERELRPDVYWSKEEECVLIKGLHGQYRGFKVVNGVRCWPEDSLRGYNATLGFDSVEGLINTAKENGGLKEK